MAFDSCKGCVAPKRYPGCHDHCPEYIEEKEKHEKRKTEYYGDTKVRTGLVAQRAASVLRARKARGM